MTHAICHNCVSFFSVIKYYYALCMNFPFYSEVVKFNVLNCGFVYNRCSFLGMSDLVVVMLWSQQLLWWAHNQNHEYMS